MRRTIVRDVATRALVCAAVCLASGALIVSTAIARPFAADDNYQLRTATDIQISPDGSRVAFVGRAVDRAANRMRSTIWLVTVADGTSIELTPAGADDTSPRWSPDGASIAVLSSDAGKPAVVVIRIADGSRKVVAHYQTSDDPLAYQGVGEQLAWAPDGHRLAYLSADPGPEPAGRDPYVITRLNYKSWTGITDNRRWHIYLVDFADGKSRQVTSGDRHEHSISWSPNGEEIAFVSNHEPDPDRVHNYDIFAVRVSDGTVRPITKTPGTEYMPRWSPDGKSIVYVGGVRALTTRESSGEDTHVWLVPASGGEGKALAPSLDRRASAVRWAPDGAHVYFLIDDRGSRVLYRVGADGRGLEPVLKDAGTIGSFAVGPHDLLAYEFASPKSPAEVFVSTPSRSQPARQLTTLNPWLSDRDVSPAEALDFTSFDGTPVQAFVTPPLTRTPGRRSPAILMIHGGPHGQQGPAFNLKAQVYAGQGYGVIMVNYRGSSGYGQTFCDGTTNDQDGSEAKDVLAGLDAALKKYDYFDPDRLGIEGGSYGGQLTNWIVTQTTRFKAAIPASGISNLISLAYTHWAADYMQTEYQGYPWERDIAQRLWEHSALAHVTKVKTPVMFIHGELDQDVNIVEPEQMYNALKQLGVEAVFLRYPREGHGLREPAHIVDALQRSLAWYARLVKGEPASTASARGQ
jgi:dipeptidyl aminopeptidase/acylaminoacyl peptidase